MAQIAGQDHHSLGMDHLPQFHLPFDIDDAPRTRIDGGRDAGRGAETAAADLYDRQTVDLADRRTFGIDKNGVIQHLLQHLPGHAPITLLTGRQRLFDMPLFDVFALVALAAQQVHLADDFQTVVDACRQALLMLRQAAAVFDQALDGAALQRPGVCLGSLSQHQCRELAHGFRAALDISIEVRKDTEHLVELIVHFLQQIIDLTRTHQNDFHFQVDDLGFQGNGVDAQFGIG